MDEVTSDLPDEEAQQPDDDEIVEIRTAPRKRIRCRIGGEVYPFKMPKIHGLIDAIREIRTLDRRDLDQAVQMFDKVEEWMFRCLDEKHAARLKARLADPDDEVDVDTIVEVFSTLVSRSTGRLPTSASG